ncbi:MAG: hypothetical protein E7627_03470 [Ruminococcaceae bacterium]|nr:hypothetical protein [Oscillospiraceae bacterium]
MNNPNNHETNKTPGGTTPVRQNLADRAASTSPRPTGANPQARRPLTNEERRRMEAARQAAMRNGGAVASATTQAKPQTTAQRPQTTATRPQGTAQRPQATVQKTQATVQRPQSAQKPVTQTQKPRPTAAPVKSTPVQESSLYRKFTADEEEIFEIYEDEEYSRDYQNNEPRRNNTTSKKRKRAKINWGIIIFAVILVGVVAFSIRYLNNNPHTPGPEMPNLGETDGEVLPPDTSETPDTDDITATEPPETEPPVTLPSHFTVTVPHTDLDVGNQILVNYAHPYARVDTVNLTNVRANKDSDLQVSSINDALAPSAFAALDKMTADMREAGCGDWLLLTSGYRDTTEQQQIWDRNLAQSGEEYTRMYVATPGHSEHHTGLAADLSFFTYDYASIPVADHDFGPWLWNNCADYGFILRYQADKTELTHTAYEAWHFRYIGVPHAYAVNALDYCYEEYIDYIRGYTATTKLFHVKSDRTTAAVAAEDANQVKDGWLIYYVPAGEGETTDILFPFEEGSVEYEISGNNADGFIVTITPKSNT